MYKQFGISREVYLAGEESEKALCGRFKKIDETAEYNQLKVISAMQKNRLDATHLAASNGYGYNDTGREVLEKVYADTFKAEAALVRGQITCGTHAIYTALSSVLRPGDELLSPCGSPYDTLYEVIGLRNNPCSLAEFGITYRQVDLKKDGTFDFDGIRRAINKKTRLVTIQRSKGYEARPSFGVSAIGELISFIKNIDSNICCMVDNCYGEFAEKTEPTEAGADMIAGSLIKNPGGGLAPSGGYITGKKEYIEQCAYRLISPGIGFEAGANLGLLPSFFQGLFLAPTVTANALKGAVFASHIYEKQGFRCIPRSDEDRFDIIQAIKLNSKENIMAFCDGIQKAAPVDSYLTPEPSDMPGYDDKVIMAAGDFIQGSSIELSADGPLREPYAVFFQGGLTWQHAKLGVLCSLQKLVDTGFKLC